MSSSTSLLRVVSAALALIYLLQLLPLALSAQSVCDNGSMVLPCPSVSYTETQWGLSWRNYTAVAIAGKGIFNPPGSILETVVAALPVLEAYFGGQNADKAVLNRTIPIGVLMDTASNQTAYLVFFFLPVRPFTTHACASPRP